MACQSVRNIIKIIHLPPVFREGGSLHCNGYIDAAVTDNFAAEVANIT
jgi:hypothetical protein